MLLNAGGYVSISVLYTQPYIVAVKHSQRAQ